MADNNKPSRFTLGLKKKQYKGETYYSWEGWFKGERNSIVVSFPCDANGSMQEYKSKDGTDLMIGNINIVSNTKKREKRNF